MFQQYSSSRRASALLGLMFLAASAVYAGVPDLQQDEFILAVVQLQIHEDLFRLAQDFSEHISYFIEQAAQEGATLVVLPEYLNVFLATVPYQEIIAQSDTLIQAAAKIFLIPKNPQTIRDVFIRQSNQVRSWMDQLYGGLAAKHGLYILAGTYFAAETSTVNPDGYELTNRSLLYGSTGEVIHEQDKVYLTDFEIHLIDLDPGSLSEVEGVIVEGYNIGLSICRDTFFPIWEDIHRNRDLWIDLRAEGTEWTQGREDFTELMPERIEGSGSDFGATASLTGEFLELFWEGKSSISTSLTDEPEILEMAESEQSSEILILSLDMMRSKHDGNL